MDRPAHAEGDSVSTEEALRDYRSETEEGEILPSLILTNSLKEVLGSWVLKFCNESKSLKIKQESLGLQSLKEPLVLSFIPLWNVNTDLRRGKSLTILSFFKFLVLFFNSISRFLCLENPNHEEM